MRRLIKIANVETGLRTPNGDNVVVKRSSVAGDQERITFAYNLVVNSNGVQYGGVNSGYDWVVLDDHPWVGYTVKQFCLRGAGITDLSVIKNYLEFMTGSDYVPEYEQDKPHDSFIYLSAPNYTDEERVWKYQFVQGYGLLAFLVTQFPFALKSEIPTVPKGIPSMQSGSYELNFGKDHYQDIDVYCSENSVVHLILTHYEDASAITEFATVYVIGGLRFVETSSQNFGISAYSVDHFQVGPAFVSDIGTVELRYIAIG